MTTTLDDLENETDEELIAITEGKYPGTDFKKISQAKIILHNRQRKREKSTTKMTLSILILTIIIAGLTGLLVYFAIVDRTVPKPANTVQSSQPKPLPPDHNEANPGRTKENKNYVPRR